MVTLEEMLAHERTIFDSTIPHHNANPTFIPLHLTGGIGDVIMALDSIKFLESKFHLVVYTEHLEAFRYFNQTSLAFKNIPDYTWVLEFDTTAKFVMRDGFHGFLVKDHEDLFLKQDALFKNGPKIAELVKTQASKYFLVADYAKALGLNRRELALHSLGYEERIGFSQLPLRPKKKIITIHDGFDVNARSLVSGRATKQWKWKHWSSLVFDLKNKYPGYEIVQLGTSKTSRIIDGVDRPLIDDTSITEAFDILAESSLHIDGDSGLAHAATKLGTTCVVMWGPTPDHFYGYDGNINLKSDACIGGCYGIRPNWSSECPIGYSTPKCMNEIWPGDVLERVSEILV